MFWKFDVQRWCKRARKRFAAHRAGIGLLFVAIAVLMAGLEAGPVRADASPVASCGACQTSRASVAVDRASYKIWPSGSRTFLNAEWHADSASASFGILNFGSASVSGFTAAVEVSNHNPLTQTPIGKVYYSYLIPALAPGQSTTVTVPLDPAQCDIFVTIDLGNDEPTVLRTGNPAAC